ncbi:MAG: hypothetical protein OXH96_22495 [Spirochaetaceae bacterium]|nr:hypothetical protein [Spirochaetaceae bacterium]
MRQADTARTGPHVAAQTAASWAAARQEELADKLSAQDQAFLDALKEMQPIRTFVEDRGHIIGREDTKHGEIAEEIHVSVRRAMDVLQQQSGTTHNDVPRTSHVDYVDRGIEIQSKYYNGLRNTLGGVSDHAEKYPEWAADSGRYHIPSDQFEQLIQLEEDGAIDGLSARTVRGVQRQVESLEQDTGRPIDELIEPGEARYDEVTRGRIHNTIEDREARIESRNDELKDHARAEYAPGLEGAATASAFGAAAGAGVQFAQAVWEKIRDGKNPFRGDFSVEDWMDVGVAGANGATRGAMAGGAVYLLTNATDLAAPFAGSLVSGLVGIGNLLVHYHDGKINYDEFVDLSLTVAAESAMVGVAAAAGQILIPIPMLGAFIGALAGKIVLSGLKDGLGESESGLIETLRSYETLAIAKLDDALRATVESLDAYYGRLADFARIAFDEGINTDLRLAASIQMAETVGVTDSEILRSRADTDAFMEA